VALTIPIRRNRCPNVTMTVPGRSHGP